MNYIKLLGIGLLEVLMKIISCYGFTNNTNLTAMLVYRYWLENYCIKKGLGILEHN